MTDDELIQRLRDGDAQVTDYLMEKYKHLVRQRAGTMYILGADRDDLIQEGMIGLFKALRDYDMGRDAAFSTFASLCISRQMYTAVEASRRKKHAPLNTYIPLPEDPSVEDEGAGDYQGGGFGWHNPVGAGSGAGGSYRLKGVLASLSELSPEEIVIDRENIEDLYALFERLLSPLERQVLDLLITGMDYQEIARVLGRDPKSTDNAIQRIKNKIRKNISS